MDSLLELGIGTSSNILRHLGCVIHSAPDRTARVLHASFIDYLIDPDRSAGCQWNINRNTHSLSLAINCLRILHSQLQFNMCGFEDSHLLNSEIPTLPSRIQNLRPELHYAGQYWGSHLRHVTPGDKVILMKLQKFVDTQFLYWLELLSLLGQVQDAGENLQIAQDYVGVCGGDLKVSLHDARCFVDGFAPVIAQSMAHIYISALPFAPRKSLVQKNFASKFPGILSYNAPLDAHWSSLQKLFLGHTNSVWSVTFSPDGRRIAFWLIRQHHAHLGLRDRCRPWWASDRPHQLSFVGRLLP
ncbi:hypothetical protein B0H14DRAFT_798800 [Mycena olivaceomarginata]|nr:hypothetical protein B0H14DRAFT_798800 [Mycena olivaceomarginata]